MTKPNHKMEAIHQLAISVYKKEKKRKPKHLTDINEHHFSIAFMYGYTIAFAEFQTLIDNKYE